MFGSRKKNKKKENGKLAMTRSWSEDSSISKPKENESKDENKKKMMLKASKSSPKESRKRHDRNPAPEEHPVSTSAPFNHARALPSYDTYMVHQRNRRTVTVTSDSIANNTQSAPGKTSNLHVRPISTPPRTSLTQCQNDLSKKHHPKRPTNLDLSNTDNNIAPVDLPYPIRHHDPAKHSLKSRPVPPPRTVSQTLSHIRSAPSRPASYHPRVSSDDFVYSTNNNNYIIYPHHSDYPIQPDAILTQSVSNGHLPESQQVDNSDVKLKIYTEDREVSADQSNTVKSLFLERRGLKDCLCFLEKARAHLQCRLDRVNERLTTITTDSQPEPSSRNSYASNLSGSSQHFNCHHLQLMHEKMEQACDLMIEAIGDKNSSLKRPNSRTSSRTGSLAYPISPISQENDLRKQLDLRSAELKLSQQRIFELEQQKSVLIRNLFSDDQNTSYLSTDI